MGSSVFPFNIWTAAGIAVALLALLEILFLFARIIENEVGLHNLKVRAHVLRLSMLQDAAQQIVEEREYQDNRTEDSVAKVLKLSGLKPPPAEDALDDEATPSEVMPAPAPDSEPDTAPESAPESAPDSEPDSTPGSTVIAAPVASKAA